MKIASLFVLFLGSCLLSGLCCGQGTFTHCSAAFLGNKMVVNAYTPTGKCVVSATATGPLTLHTVDLSPTESKKVEQLSFQVAIRDKDTKTLLLYSKESLRQVDIQQVLAKCRKGDYIVLLTLDDRYALPHNEILVQ
ncbi:hypothetical protein GCM10023187_00810 [Nibrella viscosa]|uniref:Lipoprotein n=1 Tax=Nibrella viscosa TaxID=1084524 RepID=A0ABP8JRN8_9BACT